MTFHPVDMVAASQWPVASHHQENGNTSTSGSQDQPYGEEQKVLERTQTLELDNEPPPPYQEVSDDITAFAGATPIEYSPDNGLQVLSSVESAAMEPPPRNPQRLSQHMPGDPPRSPLVSEGTMTSASSQSTEFFPRSRTTSTSTITVARRPLPDQSPSQSSATFSSTKAREAGPEFEKIPVPQRCESTESVPFEIEKIPVPHRYESTESVPRVRILPPSEALRYTREVGKATAYLIPFPKPNLRGVRTEDIPDRFLIYTPPIPPLSKPADGEKETHWHKTQRQWQEDVRKGAMRKSSKASWKGFKSSTTELIHKGINMTRTTNVEFLDRVSGGAITSTAADAESDGAHPEFTELPVTAEPASIANPDDSSPTNAVRKSSSASSGSKDTKLKTLEDITLIYPETLGMTPSRIRDEFVETLMRTREKSRNQALVASALLPVAATLDACLLVTVGGLTQVSTAWAYTNTRGTIASRKLSKGLARGEQEAQQQQLSEEPQEHDFGSPDPIPQIGDKKGKKKGINLHLQQSPHIEILRRYLDLTCLKREFTLFPTIEEAAGDVNEGSVLEAIGWSATTRSGKDLEVDFKDRTETLTPEQDEMWQAKEARDDVKRYMRKGAAEWVNWCKAFAKDPDGTLKK